MSAGILTLLIAAALLGGALLALGIRGRRSDDHPICRRCQFDLVGIYPASDRCPECGRSLGHRRAVRHGHRRRRRAPLAVGAVLLSAAILAIGGLVASELAGVNLNAYKPTPLLVFETRASTGKSTPGVLKELTKRLSDGRLDEPTIDLLAARGLALQADESRTWLPDWGDLIDAAWANGSLTEEQRTAYAQRAVVLTVTFRPRVRSGSEVGVQFAAKGGRCCWSTSHGVRAKVNSLTVGDARLKLDQLGGLGVPGPIGGGTTASIESTVMEAPPQKGRLSMDLTVTSYVGSDYPVQWPLSFSQEIEVIPPDAPLVELIDDPALADAVRACVSADRVRAIPGAEGEPVQLRGQINFTAPPVAMAFQAVARAPDGREWNLTRPTIEPGPGTHSVGFLTHIPGFDARAIDIVLRPDAAAAEASTSLDAMWNREVTIEGVSVQWPEDALRAESNGAGTGD